MHILDQWLHRYNLAAQLSQPYKLRSAKPTHYYFCGGQVLAVSLCGPPVILAPMFRVPETH